MRSYLFVIQFYSFNLFHGAIILSLPKNTEENLSNFKYFMRRFIDIWDNVKP